ncbi:MAG: S-layer homology domain-containing protein, partial [Alistipes sp.]|nr:S-layer homology domain-containing protein [Alistipes sp.]
MLPIGHLGLNVICTIFCSRAYCRFGLYCYAVAVTLLCCVICDVAIATLLLALVLLVSASVPALAAGFTDVPDSYWAKDYIDVLDAAGYLSGYEDGSFRPGEHITVCETLVILSRFYTLDELALQ